MMLINYIVSTHHCHPVLYLFRSNSGHTNFDIQMTPTNLINLLEKMEISNGARSTERNLNVPV